MHTQHIEKSLQDPFKIKITQTMARTRIQYYESNQMIKTLLKFDSNNLNNSHNKIKLDRHPNHKDNKLPLLNLRLISPIKNEKHLFYLDEMSLLKRDRNLLKNQELIELGILQHLNLTIDLSHGIINYGALLPQSRSLNNQFLFHQHQLLLLSLKDYLPSDKLQ